MLARYMITDRRAAGGMNLLLALIRRRLEEGIDVIQIREKDLEAAELFRLVQAAMLFPNPRGTKVIVNSRLDVALAAGAHGVHLPGGSPPASPLRSICPANFLIGMSCHSLAEVSTAQDADYALLAPVFQPLSKHDARLPLGVVTLAEAARISNVPVVALGGITAAHIDDCINAGAAGVAGISLFL